MTENTDHLIRADQAPIDQTMAQDPELCEALRQILAEHPDLAAMFPVWAFTNRVT